MSLCLVDYAGSDSDSDESDKGEKLEAEVLPKKWESAEAPKPPPKKKPKGPVKISLPKLTESDSSDDESDLLGSSAKPTNGKSTSALLSMLPPPKLSAPDRLSKAFAPRSRTINVDSTPTTTTTKNVSSGFTPRVVSRGKDAIAPVLSDVEFSSAAKRPKMTTSTVAAEEDTFEPQSYPEQPGSSYNRVYPEPPAYDEPVTSHYELLKIQQQLKGKRNEEINLVDVNCDSVLGNVRENLLRSITEDAQKIKPTCNVAAPTGKQKSKHQITYLAHMAVEREAELQKVWAANRIAKAQSRSKYGF